MIVRRCPDFSSMSIRRISPSFRDIQTVALEYGTSIGNTTGINSMTTAGPSMSNASST